MPSPEPGTASKGLRLVLAGARAAVGADQPVLPVAEEGEVVVGEPVEEAGAGRHLAGLDPDRRGGAQVAGDLLAARPHPRPVLDGVADVVEDRGQRAPDVLALLLRADAVDLEEHPRLGERVPVGDRRRVGVDDVEQPAVGVAVDDELRVDEQVDGLVAAGQLGRHRVDEEGHVVGDDEDHGVPARPAVGLDVRVAHLDVDGARRPVLGQLAVRERGAEQVAGLAGQEVLGRDVAVVAPDEGLELVPSPGPRGRTGEVGRRVQLLGAGELQ